jgi:hypothetical protein
MAVAAIGRVLRASRVTPTIGRPICCNLGNPFHAAVEGGFPGGGERRYFSVGPPQLTMEMALSVTNASLMQVTNGLQKQVDAHAW